ncbi:hypothetical protein AAG570_007377 [Ranatra chinensis]|uniref:Sister chromatid cohesion protein DCC1 n=1 Tax=Ranatra chinensis TaxID=642074 RepID=A0ABD0XWW6_9HEMI
MASKNYENKKQETTEIVTYVRTIDDVKTVIGHAKLDSGELRPLTQVLYMGESTPDYRLLELTPEVAQALREGSELVFRGKRDDRAVLCTSDATFEAKEAETSNSLLLIPGLKFPAEIPAADGSDRILERKEIVGVFYEYIELRKSTPRLGRLRSLLVPYAGPELERDDDTTQSFTTESLLESGGAQMSREELDVALRELTAFQVDGTRKELIYLQSIQYH